MELRGKTAIVTGAARGIGLGIAQALADRGARVAVADLGGSSDSPWAYGLSGAEELEKAAETVRSRGSESIAVACDVTDSVACLAMVEQVCAAFGRVDVLINNAGIVKIAPLVATDEADWDRMLEVNSKGVFLCSRAVAARMLEDGGGGAIVNIASMAGRQGYAGLTAYCASKFAVVGMTQAMAVELAPLGIRVNAVCPGLLATAMWMDHLSTAAAMVSGKAPGREAFEDYVKGATPLGREQTAEDIAEAVLYLIGADNVTGTSLDVNGGAVMR